jgi:hypothetical protein
MLMIRGLCRDYYHRLIEMDTVYCAGQLKNRRLISIVAWFDR